MTESKLRKGGAKAKIVRADFCPPPVNRVGAWQPIFATLLGGSISAPLPFEDLLPRLKVGYQPVGPFWRRLGID